MSSTKPTPTVFLVSGLPGVGKSTVAKYLTEQTDGTRLRTDVIRKELFPDPQYTTAETRTVYQTLIERATAVITDGQSVVLDATFTDGTYRRAIRTLAKERNVSFRALKVTCEQSIVADRLARREGISDADMSVYQDLKSEFDSFEIDHITIDNSGTLAETKAQVNQKLPHLD